MVWSPPPWSYGPSPIIDVLQPQLAAFLQTVASGFLPLESQAALFIEIAPGIAINTLTDAALKQTQRHPRHADRRARLWAARGAHFDQGEVRAAGQAMLERLGVTEEDRLKPRILSEQTITGITGHHARSSIACATAT